MNRVTLKQRYQIIKTYFENPSSMLYRKLCLALRLFFVNGIANKQNYRIWNETNPQQILQTPLIKKCTFWSGLHANGNIKPYFFKNYAKARVPVNGDPYRIMINAFLIPNMDNINPGEM